MEQMEILRQWLTQEKIRFEYYYEPFVPELLEDLEKFDLIRNEDMKLSTNQIILRRQHEKGYDISIICQFGSMGVKQGLLEYYRMGKDKEPVGYCTAEEVKEVIKEWVKNGR